MPHKRRYAPCGQRFSSVFSYTTDWSTVYTERIRTRLDYTSNNLALSIVSLEHILNCPCWDCKTQRETGIVQRATPSAPTTRKNNCYGSVFLRHGSPRLSADSLARYPRPSRHDKPFFVFVGGVKRLLYHWNNPGIGVLYPRACRRR